MNPDTDSHLGAAIHGSALRRTPIGALIDAATKRQEPERPPRPSDENRNAAEQLARDVLSDLRHFYPEVVKTRPTTWPVHLRNTIASKTATLLASQQNVSKTIDCSVPTDDASPAAPAHFMLPLELALTRWSAVCIRWNEFATGHSPMIGAFLAGWYCRCIGATRPENEGEFRDSFRTGWKEADEQIVIASR